MKKIRKHKNPFFNSYFITSVGTIVITMLTAYYLSNKTKTYKEIPYEKRVRDSAFYGLTSRPDWHIIDLGAFSIETPNDFLYTKHRGIDSKVGQIDDQVDTILFDYGLHSYDFKDEASDSNFVTWTTVINGRHFTITRKKDGAGVVGAYTKDLPDDYRLSIVCLDCHNPDRALEIFRTIKFRK